MSINKKPHEVGLDVIINQKYLLLLYLQLHLNEPTEFQFVEAGVSGIAFLPY